MSKKLLTILTVLVMALVISGCGGGSNGGSASNSSSAQPQKQYAEASIDILIGDLKDNAAKASKNYKGKDVKIVGGTVSNIDSDADYISLRGSDQFSLVNVQCYAKGKNEKAIKEQIIELSQGQPIAIYGTISDVGEVLGYSVTIDKIETQQ